MRFGVLLILLCVLSGCFMKIPDGIATNSPPSIDKLPHDMDEDYIAPWKPYHPRVPVDNDASYIPPRGYNTPKPGKLPGDQDSSYVYPSSGYYEHNGQYYFPQRYPQDNESDVLDIYPLYMD